LTESLPLKEKGMRTHTDKHEVNSEYGILFVQNHALVKFDAIDHFLVIVDLAPLQVPLTCVAVATLYNGATMSTAAGALQQQ
jgi:hypothetical protein